MINKKLIIGMLIIWSLALPSLAQAGCADSPPHWILKERNLRDIGGWSLPGRGTMATGLAYRSLALTDLSPSSLARIQGLGIKTIVDFRFLGQEPDVDQYTGPDDPELLQDLNYIPLPIDPRLFPGNDLPTAFQDHADTFLELIKLVSDPNNLPILFHCAEGKDRTGTAAAMLQYLMGVSREEIITDYVLSNEALDFAYGYGAVEQENMEAFLDWLEQDEDAFFLGLVGRGLTTDLVINFRENFTPDNILIPRGALWGYNDLGPDFNGLPDYATATGVPDWDWLRPDFNDSRWRSLGLEGRAQFGFGDGDEATPLACSTMGEACADLQAENKFPVYYFRHRFEVPDPTAVTGLEYCVEVDDGAIVYLNGEEQLRVNMPDGFDPRSTEYTGRRMAMESELLSFVIPAASLVAGTNVLAVQVHQESGGSTDLSFDLELTSVAKATIGVQVLDAITDHPLPRVRFEVVSDQVGTTPLGVETDAAGQLALDLVPVGSYRLVLIDERFQPTERLLGSPRSGASTSLEIKLDWSVAEALSTPPGQALISEGDSWGVWLGPVGQQPDDWPGQRLSTENWRQIDGGTWTAMSPGSTLVPGLFPQVSYLDANNREHSQLLIRFRAFFQQSFYLANPKEVTALTLRFQVDDGAIFYINGLEIWRENLPSATLSEGGGAFQAVSPGPPPWHQETIDMPPGLLANRNTLSVEVRQDNANNLANLMPTLCSTGSVPRYRDCPPEFGESHRTIEIRSVDGQTFTDDDDALNRIRDLSISSDITIDVGLAPVFPPGGRVVGTLRSQDGALLEGVRLEMEGGSYAFTDTEGRFVLPAPFVDSILLFPDGISYPLNSLVEGSIQTHDLTLFTLEDIPDYSLVVTREPQVLAAGFSPAFLDQGMGTHSLLALVRPGEVPIHKVTLTVGEIFFGNLSRVGQVGNGDEIWSAELQTSEDLEWPGIGGEGFRITASDWIGTVSPDFPEYIQGNEFSWEGNWNTPLSVPELDLYSSPAQRPQVIACGTNPAVIPAGHDAREILALIRSGEAPLQRVSLQRPGLPDLDLEEAGSLANGDLIYLTHPNVGIPGDLSAEGWTIRAYDLNGVSNGCFDPPS